MLCCFSFMIADPRVRGGRGARDREEERERGRERRKNR